MRLSTSTCMYFNRPDGSKMDLIQTVLSLKKAGYGVMDVNFHDATMFKQPFTTNSWEKWVHELDSIARTNEIEFSQSHAHFYNYCQYSIDNEFFETLVQRSILCSEVLGVPWVTIHAATDFSSDRPVRSSYEKGVDYFRRLADFAAEHKTGLAIENLWELNISPERRYTSAPEELVDLVDAIGRENVGICWDAAHSLIMKQDTAKVLSLIGPYMKSTHISDFVHVHHDHILPFEGIANWDEVMDGLAGLDSYEGDFTFEVFRFTVRLPEYAIPAALRYSFELGNSMVDEIERRRLTR